MSDTRDERPLEQIQFAIDELDVEKRAITQQIIRTMFAGIGVKVAQDIVDLGCTGLTSVLIDAAPEVTKRSSSMLVGQVAKAIALAKHIRSNMGGSLCGLPCYVSPDRFCRVHNTIGALQLIGNVDGPQRNPYPKGVALCSRELTDEERKQTLGMNALLGEHTKQGAVALGLEPVEDTDVEGDANAEPTAPQSSAREFVRDFVCPEHAEPEWRCRFCLAAAVIAGPFEPVRLLELSNGFETADALEAVLAKGDTGLVNLFVRAAVWQRKLVRED